MMEPQLMATCVLCVYVCVTAYDLLLFTTDCTGLIGKDPAVILET